MNKVILLVCLMLVGCGDGFRVFKLPADGTNGHSAIFSTLPATTSSCPTGGFVLSAGLDLNDNKTLEPTEVTSSSTVCNGLIGATGAIGAAGTPGAAGTVITPIQLCPSNFVPTYPSVFVESALCIGNHLYGVYSDHGGFLALLPPGNYSSNGINASCSFTITENCGIQ
jgi:hypothetical protein